MYRPFDELLYEEYIQQPHTRKSERSHPQRKVRSGPGDKRSVSLPLFAAAATGAAAAAGVPFIVFFGWRSAARVGLTIIAAAESGCISL